MKHFLMHDLLHGVFHMERGILFTLKEVLTRPGFAARDYIYGKRVNYYNVFYLMLLILGIIVFFDSYFPKLDDTAVIAAESRKVEHLLNKYLKLLYFSLVPLIALSGMLAFRRMRYNYSEYLVVSGFATLAMFIIVLINIFINLTITNYFDGFFAALCFTVPAVVYYQVTRGHINLVLIC